MDNEVFGSPEQQAMLRKGRALYDLVESNPATTYYGRGVGVVWGAPDALDLTLRLTTVLGVSNITGVPDAEVPRVRAEIEAQGYAVTHYQNWEGGDAVLAAAETTLNAFALPADVEAKLIGTESPASDVAALAEVSLGAGVLPVAGDVLRGVRRPALGAVALDETGAGVSCAAASLYANPDNAAFGSIAWWGMLATRPDRKGERLALILGAMVIREMHRRHGIGHFFTGVQPGNAPSEAVCTRMGLSPVDRATLTVVDAGVLPGGKLTK